MALVSVSPADRLEVFAEELLDKLRSMHKRVTLQADVLEAATLLKRELDFRAQNRDQVEQAARAIVPPQGRRIRDLEEQVADLRRQLALECENTAELADERERLRVELEEALMRLRETRRPPSAPSSGPDTNGKNRLGDMLGGLGGDPDEPVHP